MKHLIEWLTDFLKKHKRLDAFEVAYKSTARYPEYHPIRKKYMQVQQWQGKERRMMAGILHVVLAKTLFHPDPGQALKLLFARAYRCAGALVDFILLAQYKSHNLSKDGDRSDWGSLDWMEYYLQYFHKHKDVFAENRASSAVKRKIKEALAEVRDNEISSDEGGDENHPEGSAPYETNDEAENVCYTT